MDKITDTAARDAWNALTDSEKCIALGILSVTATDDLYAAAYRAHALSVERRK